MLRKCIALMLLSAFFHGGILAADNSEDNPKGNFHSQVVVPGELDKETVQRVILKAAIARRWNIVRKSDEIVAINLVNRGYDANLYFVYDEKKIDIYSDSFVVNKRGERKKRKEPKGWIANIKKDIGVFLNQEAHL